MHIFCLFIYRWKYLKKIRWFLYTILIWKYTSKGLKRGELDFLKFESDEESNPEGTDPK